jgi:hypothetical protein
MKHRAPRRRCSVIVDDDGLRAGVDADRPDAVNLGNNADEAIGVEMRPLQERHFQPQSPRQLVNDNWGLRPGAGARASPAERREIIKPMDGQLTPRAPL